MIIKTLRHHGNWFRHSVPYVLLDQGRAAPDQFDTIYHNLPSIELPDMIQAFNQNDGYRKQRARGIVAYHEIMSFAPEDAEHLTKDALQELAQKYIDLRCPEALCLAQAHLSDAHPHVHFLISGSNYKSAKTPRLDNSQFREVRTEMEAFQKQVTPELGHSLVYEHWDKSSPSKARSLKLFAKELVGGIEQKAHAKAISLQDRHRAFLEGIQQHPELELYHTPSGLPQGVTYLGVKVRFSWMGVSKDIYRDPLAPSKTKSPNPERSR